MPHAMGRVQLYTTQKTSSDDASRNPSSHYNENSAFCQCQQDEEQKLQDKHKSKYRRTEKCRFRILPNTCHCGEDTNRIIEWTWDNPNLPSQTIINDNTVQFHPIYSQGTSVVRSKRALEPNTIHYWEIKIVHWLSGTDLMIGVGKESVNLMEYRYKFASALGLDDKSWGYSHRGMIQHKNILKYYGKPFSKGCIIGVYLDLSLGTLEFYLNRISQGIAYRNILEDRSSLYAMICSTSAKSSVKLINTTSFRDCLQFRCMKVIAKYPQLLEKVQNIPGLMSLIQDVWFLLPKERYQYNQQENNLGVHHADDNDNEAIFLSTYTDVQHSSDDDVDIHT